MPTVPTPAICSDFPTLADFSQYTFTTGISGGVLTNIISILIDGVQYNLTDTLDGPYTMTQLVNLINNWPVVSSKIVAAVEPDATHVALLVLRAIDDTVTTVDIINDYSFIANFSPNNVVQSLTGVRSTTPVAKVPSTSNRKLEPKTATPALNEVYIPLHTEVVSDKPTMSMDYWFDILTNSIVTATPSSVVATKHIDTGEDIVLVLSSNKHHSLVSIDAMYANGPKAGQYVTSGYTAGQTWFPIVNQSWVDTYWGNPELLSASMAIDPVDSTIYIKTIVGGTLFVDEANIEISASNSCVTITAIDSRLTDVLWSKMIALDPIPGNAQGYGAYQRSERGIVVDANRNIYMANNTMHAVVDAYYGTSSVSPMVEVTKLDHTGTIIWSKYIDSSNFTSTVDGNTIIIQPQSQNGTSWSAYPSIDVAADGSVFVAHGQLMHKLSSAGDMVYSKNFWDLDFANQYGASFVTDIQVHKTTGKLYVGVSGFWSNGVNRGVILELADNATTTDPSWYVWLSPTSNFNPSPWNGAIMWVYSPVVMHLDSGANKLYASTYINYHGVDSYHQTPSGDVTMYTIDVTTAAIDWSQDISLSTVDTSTSAYIDAPDAYGSSRIGGGMAMSMVKNAQGQSTSLCFTAPVYLGEGAAPHDEGSGVFAMSPAQAINAIAPNTAFVNYSFADVTAFDRDVNTQLQTFGYTCTVDPGTAFLFNPTQYVRSNGTTTINTVSTYDAGYTDHLFVLPPFNASIKTSLYVENIATIGELQLGGIFPTPGSTVGLPTDKKGALRASADGIFYCSADYDGSTEVWKNIPFGGGGRIKLEPPGYNPNYNLITGCPADKIGDVYMTSSLALVCTQAYTGSAEIWQPVMPSFGTGLSITTNAAWAYDSSNPTLWPNGARLTDYTLSITAPPPASERMVSLQQTTLYVSTANNGYVYFFPSQNTYTTYVYLTGYYWDYSNTFKFTIVNRSSKYTYVTPPLYGYMEDWTRVIPPNTTRTFMSTGVGQFYAVDSRQASSQTIQLFSYNNPAISPDNGPEQTLYVQGNFTVPNPSSAAAMFQGQRIHLTIYMNGGNYTLTFGSQYRFVGGTAPTTPTNGKAMVIDMVRNETGNWLCSCDTNITY